ncbi:MAG: hypothetical protein KY464_14150 [Gemmatimonadetes bacterium]|nr:hypothetical protein [Gemmatimonadota bacterium]
MTRNRWLAGNTDKVLPADPARRRARAALGCATLLVLLTLLIWFIATHTQTFDNPALWEAVGAAE